MNFNYKLYSSKDILKKREFNLEKAKLGKPVVTHSGDKVQILKYDMVGTYPILAVRTTTIGSEIIIRVLENGSYIEYLPNLLGRVPSQPLPKLLLVLEPVVKWYNLYENYIGPYHDCEKWALKHSKGKYYKEYVETRSVTIYV